MKAVILIFMFSASAVFANAMVIQGTVKMEPRTRHFAIHTDGGVSKFYLLTGSLTKHLVENKQYILDLQKTNEMVGEFQAYEVVKGQRLYILAGRLDDRNPKDFQFMTIHRNLYHLEGPAVNNWLELKKKLPDHDYSQTPLIVNVASDLSELHSNVKWLSWQVVPEFNCVLEKRSNVQLRFNKIRADGSRLEALITAVGAGETLFISQGFCESNRAENPGYQCEYMQGSNLYGTSFLQREDDFIEGDSISMVLHRTDAAQTKLNFICAAFDWKMLNRVSEDKDHQ